MAAQQRMVPGGPYVNEQANVAARQAMIPGGPFLNAPNTQTAGIVGPLIGGHLINLSPLMGRLVR